MEHTYRSAWWSVRLPAGWSARDEEDGVAFHANPARGTLQVSAVRKEGAVVHADVLEFARERLGEGAPLHPVRTDAFQGVAASYDAEGEHWREWWVYSGSLLVYATYVVDGAWRGTEDAAADAIIGSLRPA